MEGAYARWFRAGCGGFSEIFGLRNKASKPNANKPMIIIVQLAGNGVALTDGPAPRLPSEPGPANPGSGSMLSKPKPLLPAPNPEPSPNPLEAKKLLISPLLELRNPASPEKLLPELPLAPLELKTLAEAPGGEEPLLLA